MNDNIDIKSHESVEKVTPAGTGGRHRFCVWASLLLAVAAWLVLWFGNGYVSIAVALIACVVGFFGICGNKSGIRRLAVAAVIAAIVLMVVVAAYLMVLKIGLA